MRGGAGLGAGEADQELGSCPTLSESEAVPPRASTTRREMVSPRPVPRSGPLVVKNGVKSGS